MLDASLLILACSAFFSIGAVFGVWIMAMAALSGSADHLQDRIADARPGVPETD